MKRLTEIEAEFQQALLAQNMPLPETLLSTGPESILRLFGIYRRAYWLRLVESLGIDFPGLKALLGEEKFGILASNYLKANPSRYRSIRWLGMRLVDFIAADEACRNDPMILDMARLDWAIAHAFDAEDKTPATLQDLIAIPPESWGSLRLEFHPSLSLLSIVSPVWKAREGLLADPTATIEHGTIHPSTLMIWRFNLDIKCQELAKEEAHVQRLMKEGGTFADLCETLATVDPEEAAIKAATILKGWIEWGAIADLILEPFPATTE